MKRIVGAVLATALALIGLAAQADQAAASTYSMHTPKGWGAWTKEYCESGKFVHMRRLSGPYNTWQGREYVYKRNGRLCIFTTDHLTGSHSMTLDARVPGREIAYDSGYYSKYAGAFAAPRGRCIVAMSTLQVKHPKSTWGYATMWRKYCP